MRGMHSLANNEYTAQQRKTSIENTRECRSPTISKICSKSSALLDLRAAQRRVDALVHEVPVHLVEHLIHVARFGAEQGTLAIGHRLEQLHGEAAGAHLGRKPDPAL